ncbi:MAG: hypothetical protein EBU90_22755, partial [Proteobacteria bacterium]|nr:hypothetical protein [Pseudomonadota bacterium]
PGPGPSPSPSPSAPPCPDNPDSDTLDQGMNDAGWNMDPFTCGQMAAAAAANPCAEQGTCNCIQMQDDQCETHESCAWIPSYNNNHASCCTGGGGGKPA